MTKKPWIAGLGIVVASSFLGVALAAEYTDPAKQARWEQTQQKRAEKTEHRRTLLGRWIDGNLKKLKPNPDAHRGSDTAGTMTNIQTRSGMK